MAKRDEIFSFKTSFFSPELTNEHRNVKVQLNSPLILAHFNIYLRSRARHVLNTAMHFTPTPASG